MAEARDPVWQAAAAASMMLNMAASVSLDSTASISSLLASCSLSSTGPSSRSRTSVRYKDRLYDSASKALEDYILDYEEGLQSTETKAGKISSRTRLNQPINKRELQHQPSVPRRRRRPLTRDADLLSLTTDDLLSFPSDGSFPLYRPYQSERKHDGTCKTLYGSSFRKQKTPPAYSKRHLHLMDPETYNDIAYGPPKERPNGEYSRHVAARGNKALTSPCLVQEPPVSTKDYPRWLTSHKPELSVSGITSVPEAKYPVWLKNHGLLSNSDSPLSLDRLKSNQEPLFSDMNHRLHGTCSYKPTRVSCRDDEGFSRRKESKSAIGHVKTPLKSDHFDFLLREPGDAEVFKAEIPNPSLYERSPQTEDVLEAERSWENNPFPVKSPVPVLCKDSDLGIYSQSKSAEDPDGFLMKDHTACRTSVSSFSGGNHHGPVEALKHMLFNLQTFQHSFTQDKTTEQIEKIHKFSEEADEDLRHLDREMFPVNKSLQKALRHLSRLKELVGDSSVKQYKEKSEEL